MIWNPILNRIVTLQELETHWSIYDVFNANDALEIKNEIEQIAYEDAERANRGKKC